MINEDSYHPGKLVKTAFQARPWECFSKGPLKERDVLTLQKGKEMTFKSSDQQLKGEARGQLA